MIVISTILDIIVALYVKLVQATSAEHVTFVTLSVQVVAQSVDIRACNAVTTCATVFVQTTT